LNIHWEWCVVFRNVCSNYGLYSEHTRED
jgi:hypothetical protein